MINNEKTSGGEEMSNDEKLKYQDWIATNYYQETKDFLKGAWCAWNYREKEIEASRSKLALAIKQLEFTQELFESEGLDNSVVLGMIKTH